jgi:threonyl-tRNA synthetase
MRSYRELPMRFAESSTLHRDEPGGTLHGLLRVKHVTQDDAHIFCTPDQIEDEIFGCLDFATYLYDIFGMNARAELSTRPEKKLGTDEEWDFTDRRCAAPERRAAYDLNEGDGAFYAEDRPAHDRRARPLVEMATIQLDADASSSGSPRRRRQHRAHAACRPPRAARP